MAGKYNKPEDECMLYKKDTRIPCKYGIKCYQKNPSHLKKYKHPPKRKLDDVRGLHQKKKVKTDKHEGTKIPPSEVDVDSSSDQDEHGLHQNEKVKINKPESMKIASSEVHIDSSSDQDSDLLEVEKQTENDTATGTSQTVDPKVGVKGGSNEDAHEEDCSPCDVKEYIKQKFLVEMPNDFYGFWSFCEQLAKNNPSEALSSVGLTLVGPFDALSGKLGPGSGCNKSQFLRHWRYYFDPPEFQTVIKGEDKKQFHIGYFRDDPKDVPCFVGSNCAAVDCIIIPMAENLFGAVNLYLEQYRSKADPFQKMKVSRIQSSLQEWAATHKVTLEQNTTLMKSRSRKTLCKTFHHAGMVVPYDKKTELGYRSLIESERNLKKLLEKVVSATTEEERDAHLGKLQEVITAANIATDECDFGTGLELALALFCFGGEVFHNTIRQLAATAYGLLGREEFATVLEAHLEDRKKGNELSIMKK